MDCKLLPLNRGSDKGFCPSCDPKGKHPIRLGTKRNCLMVTAPKRKLLGDRVEQALGLTGITEKRVSNWLGRPCGCKKRREQLNLLHSWAEKKLKGLFVNDQEATDELEEIIE